MKTTYEDFLDEYSYRERFEHDMMAKGIFEILAQDENIIAMIEYSEAGKPALAACVNQIEAFFEQGGAKGFDLSVDFNKQCVGRMVKTILRPFGYETHIQKSMPKTLESKHFRSATSYQKTGTALLKVVKTIVEA